MNGIISKTALFILLILFQVLEIDAQINSLNNEFVDVLDTALCKPTNVVNNGFVRSCFVQPVSINAFKGLDNAVELKGNYLICIEGRIIDSKKNGVFKTYIFKKNTHGKLKIWDQTYEEDVLSGNWIEYSIEGVKAVERLMESGQMRQKIVFWPDGKTKHLYYQYRDSESSYKCTTFNKLGVIESLINIRNSRLNGRSIKYYSNGNIEEECTYSDGFVDGVWKYYHTNGQVWIEQIFRNGKNWKVVANYDSTGRQRDAGTLENGEGSLLLYDKDNSVRDTLFFLNGVQY